MKLLITTLGILLSLSQAWAGGSTQLAENHHYQCEGENVRMQIYAAQDDLMLNVYNLVSHASDVYVRATGSEFLNAMIDHDFLPAEDNQSLLNVVDTAGLNLYTDRQLGVRGSHADNDGQAVFLVRNPHFVPYDRTITPVIVNLGSTGPREFRKMRVEVLSDSVSVVGLKVIPETRECLETEEVPNPYNPSVTMTVCKTSELVKPQITQTLFNFTFPIQSCTR